VPIDAEPRATLSRAEMKLMMAKLKELVDTIPE
jgi:hypothetical protein